MNNDEHTDGDCAADNWSPVVDNGRRDGLVNDYNYTHRLPQPFSSNIARQFSNAAAPFSSAMIETLVRVIEYDIDTPYKKPR